jgi:hypothetical protein
LQKESVTDITDKKKPYQSSNTPLFINTLIMVNKFDKITWRENLANKNTQILEREENK